MATTLLKKAWESVSNCSSSNSTSNPLRLSSSPSSCNVDISQIYLHGSFTGAFDRIPIDIFIQILKILGPKETAKLSVVCKYWKFIVSENRLWIYFLQNTDQPWESVFFAEKYLRAGYDHLLSLPHQMPELSFMHIYGQRARVPGAIIIDGGSGYCKYGWSKYDSPSGRSPTFLEFGNIESPLYYRLRHFYATIYSRMQVKPSRHPVVVSVPICQYDDTDSAIAARRQLKEAMYLALYGMDVPAIVAINQATLTLFAARRTSGIVVNIGFHKTSVVPILHGKVMRKIGVEVVGIGALKLTGFLREQMQQRNMNFGSLYTVRSLKENLCYVALDYETELSKDTKASLEVASDGCFTLSKERFQTGELLFQPRLAGLLAMGVQQAVALCMDHCLSADITDDEAWFKTIVLAGGSACLPGLAERLEKELRGYFPSMSNGIRVIPPPYGADSAWHGAKLVSNLSTFPGSWCMTKKRFRYKSQHNRIW